MQLTCSGFGGQLPSAPLCRVASRIVKPNVLHGRLPFQALRASAPISIIASPVLSPDR